MSISVIVPAYNEENTICQVVDALLAGVENLGEIIIIDDGSRDRTGEICKQLQGSNPLIHYFPQPSNMGKTEALKEGFRRSTGEIVIVQDADLEYDPAEINRVVKPIEAGKADVVYGSRFQARNPSQSFYLRSYLANRFITLCSNLFTGHKFSDVETCYKAFRGEIIRNMIITSKRFGFEVEVTAKIAKLDIRVDEVAISYNGRSYAEGKKIGIQDGIMALVYIVKYNWFCSQKSAFSNLDKIDRR